MADSTDYDEPSAKHRDNREAVPKLKESTLWKHRHRQHSTSNTNGYNQSTSQSFKATPSYNEGVLDVCCRCARERSVNDERFHAPHAPEPLSGKKTEALNSKVAAMVALDLQPYSVVEKHGLKVLMAEVVPNYRLPSQTMLSCTLVPRLYHDTRKKVKAELSSAFEGSTRRTTAITFTSNMWTSRANEIYISFTCHFLNQSFKIKRFTLNTCRMAVSHSADNIAEILDEMSTEWEAPDDCRKYIVTDNGHNIRAIVGRLLN